MSTENRLYGYKLATKRGLSVEFMSTLCYIILARGFSTVFPSWAGFLHSSFNLRQCKKGTGLFLSPVSFLFLPIFQKYRFLTSNVGTSTTLISFSNSDRLSGASSCFTLPSLVYPVNSRIKLPYCEFGSYLLLSLK